MTDEEFEKWLGDVAFTALLSDESGYLPYVDASDVRTLFARLRAEQRWIPVDQDPQDGEEYLCATEFGDIITARSTQDEGFEWGRITHFMPLPPLPGAEGGAP